MNRLGFWPLALPAAAAGLWALAAAALIAAAAYLPLPVSDQWWAPTAADNWTNLFAQHNEHRLILPRLLFLADFALDGGYNRLNLAATFIIQAAHVVLLTALATRGDPAATPATRLLFAGFAAALFFWGYQYENFTSGFQAQFVGVFAAGTAAFYAAAAGRMRWALVWAAAAAATMANGLLVGLLLAALIGVLTRTSAQRAGGVALFALALIGLHLWGYVTPSHHARPLATLLSMPERVAAYLCAYLGGPFAALFSGDGEARLRAALLLGAAGCLLTPWALLRGLRAAPAARPWRLALGAALLFALGSGGLTALGRANFPLEQAFASRYAAPAMLFWAALAGLLRPTGGRAAVLWAASATAVAVALAATQPAYLELARIIGDARRTAAAAILSEVDDVRVTPQVLPYAAFGLGEVPRVRAARVGAFREAWTQWLGKTLQEAGSPAAETACLGGVATVESAPQVGRPAWRLAGTAALPNDQAPPRAVLLTDAAADRVVGMGLADPGGGGWRAYAATENGRALQAYALSGDRRRMCRLGGPFVPPAALNPPPPERIGPALPVPPPEIIGSWKLDGYNAAAGAPPLDGAVYGSWVSGDADTGALRWSVPLNGARAFILPLVTGPSPLGQSLTVNDPRDGSVIARLDAPGGADKWTAWGVTLPDGFDGDRVTVQAADAGTGWAQWLAIGAPREFIPATR